MSKKTFVAICVLGLLIILIASRVSNREGVINISSSDCREVIYTKSNSWDAITHSYTCGSMFCARFEFNSGGTCVRSWWYEKKNSDSTKTSESDKAVNDYLKSLNTK